MTYIKYSCICGYYNEDRRAFLTHLELDPYDHSEDYPYIEYDDFEEWYAGYEANPGDPLGDVEAGFDAGYVLGWDEAAEYYSAKGVFG